MARRRALRMATTAPTMAAMKASFFACIRNFFTFVVYGLVMMVAAIVAVLSMFAVPEMVLTTWFVTHVETPPAASVIEVNKAPDW